MDDGEKQAVGSEEDIRFWQEYLVAFEKAQELTVDRMPAYVGTESILDFWIHGEQDLIYEINKKMVRLRRQMECNETVTADKIEDTILDQMNYLAFLYALLETEKPKPKRVVIEG